ncbi:hypothetical protein COO60DRAFT_106589 [Scenedesmus sp. NREL 46B-D3]|nr:hypothetical protein COO60DRAFT_106589 [Scenedesmus sp. NREL 46B-D3]
MLPGAASTRENTTHQARAVRTTRQMSSSTALVQGNDAQLQGDKWRRAFLQVAAAMGMHAQQGNEPQPEAVLQAVASLQQSEQRLQLLQQHEAALQVQVAHLTLQNMELRRELGSGWSAAEPSVMQVRQLVLDPAIQQEFGRLRRELEEQRSTISQLKEQNDSLTFTAESKMGRALINKTKLLAEENQEMAAQLREGPAAAQGALLALERHHAAELRKALSEVRDHCSFLEEENEELSMLAFLNERQITELQAAAAVAGGGPAGGADRDRGERGDRDRARSRSRSRDRERDRDKHQYSMSKRGGGYLGGRGRGHFSSRGRAGDGQSSRGRGRNWADSSHYAGHKRPR